MYKYVIKRLLMLIAIVLGISFLVFFIMDLAPGDAAMQILGMDATEEALDELREEMGLNDPLLVRYGRYMWNLLHGDLGYSYMYKQDVSVLFKQRIGTTLLLSLVSTILGAIISIPLGVIAALKRGSLVDNSLSAFATLGMSAPNFWIGLMLIILFSLKLRILPSSGGDSWKSYIMPSLTLMCGGIAQTMRTTRSSMLDVIYQDYLMLARAKGVSERRVIWKHSLKNALIPIITIVGTRFASGVGGAVVTESIFSLPGVGAMMVNSIKARDLETVTGFLIMVSVITSVILLIIDILYAYVDPRIKAQYSK